jgi:hypothetical protein
MLDLVKSGSARCTALLLIVLATACGGGSDGTGPGPGPGPGPSGSFTISATANALTIARNLNGSLTITITRAGGFSGAVDLTATGLPSGVTASFSPAQVPAGQTTTTLTVTPGGTAVVATSSFTIQATGTGVASQSLTVQLTVTSPPLAGPFTLSLSVSSYLALPPQILSWMPELTITRNPGFTGPVAISVTGVPPLLVAAVTPTNVTGTTARMGIIDGGVPPGTYTATIRGVAAGGLGEQSIMLPITVAPPTVGSIQWKFCENGNRAPQWFLAVRDGTGPWTRIVPSAVPGGVQYAFNLTQATAQAALVTLDSGGFRATIYQSTAQEMTARAGSECTLNPGVSQRTVTGQVTGVGSNELSMTSMGWWFQSLLGPGTYTMLNQPAGPIDLLTVRGNLTQQLDFAIAEGVFRRGVNTAAGGSNAVIDFNSAEPFVPTASTWTFTNTQGQPFSTEVHLLTAGGSALLMHHGAGLDRAHTVRTMYNVPPTVTIQGDLHQMLATMTALGPTRASKQIVTYARTFANRSVSFGPDLPAPAVTAVTPGAPAGRVQATGTLPAEYNAGVTLDLTQTSIARFGTLHATRGFLGAGANYLVQMPDLSSALGWDRQFAMRGGVSTEWWVSGNGPALDIGDGRYHFTSVRARWTGAQTGVTMPAEGATYLIARQKGVLVP